jgi:hypothetical protein
MPTAVSSHKVNERLRFGNLGVDERVILRRIFKK